MSRKPVFELLQIELQAIYLQRPLSLRKPVAYISQRHVLYLEEQTVILGHRESSPKTGKLS